MADFANIHEFFQKNDNYKEFIKSKAKELMGGKKIITADKAFSIFKGYNKNLSPEMTDKIQKIAAMDGDNNVSLSEMSAIYALFDMELGSDDKIHFDGKIGGDDAKLGINEATDKEVQLVVDAFKTEEEKLAAKAQEQKLKLTEFADKIKHNLYLGDYANMNEIIDEGVFFEGSFEQLKSKLEEKGIEFTEDSNDKSLSYELDNKKYIVRNITWDNVIGEFCIVRNGTKEKLNKMGWNLYSKPDASRYITEVYDASGKLVQTATTTETDFANEETGSTDNVIQYVYAISPIYRTVNYNITKYDNKGRPVLGLAYNKKNGKVTALAISQYNHDNSYQKYYRPGIDMGKSPVYGYYSSNGILLSELYGRELEHFKYYDAKNAE